MAAGDAIQEATRNRLRPIFMSTLTSVVGMLPLVLFPGAGSELYRGLGSVVVGGLALSALLTLIVVPPLMSVFLGVSAPKPHDDQLATEPAAPLPEAALAEGRTGARRRRRRRRQRQRRHLAQRWSHLKACIPSSNASSEISMRIARATTTRPKCASNSSIRFSSYLAGT